MDIRRLGLLTFIILGYLFIPWTSYGKPLVIDFLNVGQGDSALIRTPEGVKILIDGGPDGSVIDQLDQLLPFWDRSIDAIIPTHPQADHINGLIDVVKRYEVKESLTTPARNSTVNYTAFQNELALHQIPQVLFMRGEQIGLGEGLVLRSLWPDSNTDWNHINDLNNVAQICELDYGEFSALFTSDAGANIEQSLENQHDDRAITLLKVPHHGSKYGMENQYLAKIHPIISVISVGAKNRYGHPSTQALEQLDQIHSDVMRTDQDGRVEVLVNGDGFWFTNTGIKYNN